VTVGDGGGVVVGNGVRVGGTIVGVRLGRSDAVAGGVGVDINSSTRHDIQAMARTPAIRAQRSTTA